MINLFSYFKTSFNKKHKTLSKVETLAKIESFSEKETLYQMNFSKQMDGLLLEQYKNLLLHATPQFALIINHKDINHEIMAEAVNSILQNKEVYQNYYNINLLEKLIKDSNFFGDSDAPSTDLLAEYDHIEGIIV